MLILTRRVSETIIIGDDIHVKVLSVKGNQVRIGIQAPDDVSVNREEIHERIQQELAIEVKTLKPAEKSSTLRLREKVP